MEVISLKEARVTNLKRYFTGKLCPRGHISERFVSDRGCCACKAENNHLPQNKAARKRYASEHPEQMNQYWRDWYYRGGNLVKREWKQNNPDKCRGYDETWRVNNPEKDKQKHRDSYWRHPEKRRAKSRKHAKDNPARYAFHAATRRARILRATPPWVDLTTVLNKYKEAQQKTITTGIKHVVDHVIPLQGKRVSGLHVAGNLAIITGAENLSKGNRYDPEDGLVE